MITQIARKIEDPNIVNEPIFIYNKLGIIIYQSFISAFNQLET